jgi:ABC-2 type transport system permease protein
VIRYLRMFRAFASTEFQFEMEYRANMYLSIFEMLLVIGTSIGAVLIMFGHTTTMNGWTLPQMIVLLGVYYVIQGGVSLLFSPSFERLMEHVRVGTLDFHLLKPVNTQFLVSTRHLKVIRGADLLLGLGVVIVGLVQVGGQVGIAQALMFALSLIFGWTLVYSLLLGLVTLSFWFVRVENLLAIFWAFTEAGRFPVDVYPLWLRVSLSTVVPIGIAVTAPANVIAGRMDWVAVAVLGAGTVLTVGIASALWRWGLKSYTGASA